MANPEPRSGQALESSGEPRTAQVPRLNGDEDPARLFMRYALMGSTVRRAAKVATVVTPILTVLNHSAELMALQLDGRFWLQVALTFFVPYSVSTYSSAMGAISEQRRAAQVAGAGAESAERE